MGDRERGGVRSQAGYSLIELSVVTLILSILAGIAISTYLSQTQKADRSAAISTLSNMRLVGESLYADQAPPAYVDDPAVYEDEQGSYSYVDGATPSTGTGVVSIHSADPSWVSFAVRGRGECYYLRLEVGAEALRRSHAAIDEGAGVECTADEFPEGVAGTGAWE